MAKKEYRANIDVRCNNAEDERMREDFKMYSEEQGFSMSDRARELIRFDLNIYKTLGKPADLVQILKAVLSGDENLLKTLQGEDGEIAKDGEIASAASLIKAIAEAKDFLALCKHLNVSVFDRIFQLMKADANIFRIHGEAMSAMVVRGDSIGDNLPRKSDGKKKLLENLRLHDMEMTEEEYNCWLLLSEKDGFEKEAKTPRFSHMIVIANYLYPGDEESIDAFGELWTQDGEREKIFQRQQEARLLSNLNYRPNDEYIINDFSETLR